MNNSKQLYVKILIAVVVIINIVLISLTVKSVVDSINKQLNNPNPSSYQNSLDDTSSQDDIDVSDSLSNEDLSSSKNDIQIDNNIFNIIGVEDITKLILVFIGSILFVLAIIILIKI